MPVKVASEWLNSCSGCEIAILNLGEALLTVLPHLDFVHMPVLMDHKYYGQTGGSDVHHLEIPEAVVGLVSGGIRNQEHLEVARAMRTSCQVLIALGTCACYGGIPSLINLFGNGALLDCCYHTETTDPGAHAPGDTVPALLDRCYALDEKVKVDIYLPGCPPHPDQIAEVLTALLEGRAPELPTKSVCDTCPTIRDGKGKLTKMRRFTENAHYEPGGPLSEMHCLLEQGLLCMGPVTRAGCAGDNGSAPRCLIARVPCRGCFGPVQREGNQLLDMYNALASNGIDFTHIADPSSMLRFSGAHGLLRVKANTKLSPRRKSHVG